MPQMNADYWMTPEDLVRLPNAGREFVSDPRETPAEDGEFSRREFLKLMGISSVLAGAAACTRRPVEKIIPYLNKPEETVLGDALWYASTSTDCPCQCGVLVKTREGRPIKLEGNPDHPVNRGGLCARAQTSVWNLYDPDRLKAPVIRERKDGTITEVSWVDMDARLAQAFEQIRGRRGKARLLTGAITGPATKQLINSFLASLPDARHIIYEPVNAEEIARAQAKSYGEAVVPRYRFDRASFVLSLGADFLGTWISPVEFARDWARRRKLQNNPKGSMSRLVCFEPILTVTGSNADERYPVSASGMVNIALAIIHELAIVKGAASFVGGAEIPFAEYSIKKQAEFSGIPAAVLERIAAELWAARGKSLVVGGLLTGPLGLALQVAVNFLNSLLGNEGTTVDGVSRPSAQGKGSFAELSSLLNELQEGHVDCLVIAGINPAYSLPGHLGFADLLHKAPLVIHISDRIDETGLASDAILPLSHFLESWGDAEPQAGVVSIIQPTISPLYASRTLSAHLIAWAPGVAPAATPEKPDAPAPTMDARWYDYLKKYWREKIYTATGVTTPFDLFWESVLRQGCVILNDGDAVKSRTFIPHSIGAAIDFAKTGRPVLELVCYPSLAMHDGRYANNSWMQELPDPITKITWDNYLCVSPRTAKRLGLNEEDVVEINDAVALPIHIQPGLHDDVVAAAIGYGRKAVGRVGNSVGTSVHDLAIAQDGRLSWSGMKVGLKNTGRTHKLAVTQGHHRIEGRPIIQETSLEEYHKDPRAGGHEEEGTPPSMWTPQTYTGHRWGMAIDLNSCTGCSACIVSCMVENNIPAVGKKQVLKGREMHWIRIDRYYSGPDENPQTVHQPMLCQHCTNAPCETVCPVLATVHDSEGLNSQIYNRCVGTRYCSNNCPYKVRRFNWFDYGSPKRDAYAWTAPLHLMLNPDVTVREKGVMEKCTMCVQRIRKGKHEAKAKGVTLADGDIKTACQQSCPTQAIVFGDINDPESEVSRLTKDPRGFHVLRELNTVPVITYMTKVRNT